MSDSSLMSYSHRTKVKCHHIDHLARKLVETVAEALNYLYKRVNRLFEAWGWC